MPRRRWIFPASVAVGVIVFIAIADTASWALHERAVAQPLTRVVNGLSRMLALPGLLFVQASGIRVGHHTSAAAWLAMLAVNVPFYFVGALVIRWLWAGRYTSLTKKELKRAAKAKAKATAIPPDASTPPKGPDVAQALSRRQVLTAGRRLVLAGGAGLFAYGFLVETRRFEVTRRSFPVRGLPQSLDGLVVAQLTDLHHGPFMSLSWIREVIATTNALSPDLVLLTGDYVHQSPQYIRPVVDALAGLKARIGVLGVLGNHDWWEDGEETQRQFARVGLPLIDNGRMFVSRERKLVSGGVEGLCIAGVGDLWEGGPDYEAALEGVPPLVPRVLLSHNPDVAEARGFVQSGHRVDLMLCGHTHGGQVRVPGFGTPMVPSRYGQKYASGLVQGPVCPVYISRGLGTAIMPVRFRVVPEIALIELRAAT
jgi:uncharacterized protein